MEDLVTLARWDPQDQLETEVCLALLDQGASRGCLAQLARMECLERTEKLVCKAPLE